MMRILSTRPLRASPCLILFDSVCNDPVVGMGRARYAFVIFCDSFCDVHWVLSADQYKSNQ